MHIYGVNIFDLALTGTKSDGFRENPKNPQQMARHNIAKDAYGSLPWGKWFVVTTAMMIVQFGMLSIRIVVGALALWALIEAVAYFGPPVLDYAQNWQFKSKAEQIVKDTRSVTDHVSIEETLTLNKITNIGCFIVRIEEGATGLTKKIVHVVDVGNSKVISTGDLWQFGGHCKDEAQSKKEEAAKHLISPSEIEFKKSTMEFVKGMPHAEGTLRNNSKHTVSSVTVTYTIKKCSVGMNDCSFAGRGQSEIRVEVPPGQERVFDIYPIIHNLPEMDDFEALHSIDYVTAKIE
jgi:hypothetical protein